VEPAAKQPEGRGELSHRKISCRAIVHIRADRALDFFHRADRPSAFALRVKGFQRQDSLASEADFHGIMSFEILQ
jgi:hypothetical protein